MSKVRSSFTFVTSAWIAKLSPYLSIIINSVNEVSPLLNNLTRLAADSNYDRFIYPSLPPAYNSAGKETIAPLGLIISHELRWHVYRCLETIKRQTKRRIAKREWKLFAPRMDWSSGFIMFATSCPVILLRSQFGEFVWLGASLHESCGLLLFIFLGRILGDIYLFNRLLANVALEV